MTQAEEPEVLHEQHERNLETLNGLEYGQMLAPVYEAATAMNPALKDIEIAEFKKDEPFQTAFKPGWRRDDGEDAPQVFLQPDGGNTPYYFMADVHDIPEQRVSFANAIGLQPDKYDENVHHAVVFLSQLGAAGQYMEHQDDHDAFEAEIEQQKSTLPVPELTPTQILHKWVDNRFNKDYWQQAMEAHGVESQKDLAILQDKAFRELPFVKKSDEFAAAVIKANPDLIGQIEKFGKDHEEETTKKAAVGLISDAAEKLFAEKSIKAERGAADLPEDFKNSEYVYRYKMSTGESVISGTEVNDKKYEYIDPANNIRMVWNLGGTELKVFDTSKPDSEPDIVTNYQQIGGIVREFNLKFSEEEKKPGFKQKAHDLGEEIIEHMDF